MLPTFFSATEPNDTVFKWHVSQDTDRIIIFHASFSVIRNWSVAKGESLGDTAEARGGYPRAAASFQHGAFPVLPLGLASQVLSYVLMPSARVITELLNHWNQT